MAGASSKPLWLELLAKHGLATLIALFLVWHLSYRLEAKVNQILDTVSGQHLLLRAICLNTAKTDVERDTCRGSDER